MIRKKYWKKIGIVVVFILIAMFLFLGYRLSYKKDIEKNIPTDLK